MSDLLTDNDVRILSIIAACPRLRVSTEALSDHGLEVARALRNEPGAKPYAETIAKAFRRTARARNK